MACITTLTARRPSARGIPRHVVWITSIAALGGLLFSYYTGVISGTLLFISKDYTGMSSTQKGLPARRDEARRTASPAVGTGGVATPLSGAWKEFVA